MRYFIFLLFILLFIMPCISQTTVDTIIASEVPMTGNITTFNEGNAPEIRFFSSLTTGDNGMPWIPPYYTNRVFKAYVTFELNDSFSRDIIDSINIRLWSSSNQIRGNAITGTWPIWDVEGGDTVKLVIDHIDFGNELIAEAWTAGDEGDPMTIESEVGYIEFEDWDSVNREFIINITGAVMDDINNNRDKSQFRISFQIDTDNDTRTDAVTFFFGGGTESRNPRLLIYKTETSINEQSIIKENNLLKIENFPNPFNPNTSIKFTIPETSYVSINIYNVKGQLVKQLINNENMFVGGHTVAWDGTDNQGVPLATGVYLYRIECVGQTASGKMLLLK